MGRPKDKPSIPEKAGSSGGPKLSLGPRWPSEVKPGQSPQPFLGARFSLKEEGVTENWVLTAAGTEAGPKAVPSSMEEAGPPPQAR